MYVKFPVSFHIYCHHPSLSKLCPIVKWTTAIAYFNSWPLHSLLLQTWITEMLIWNANLIRPYLHYISGFSLLFGQWPQSITWPTISYMTLLFFQCHFAPQFLLVSVFQPQWPSLMFSFPAWGLSIWNSPSASDGNSLISLPPNIPIKKPLTLGHPLFLLWKERAASPPI